MSEATIEVPELALELRHISKSFGANLALDDVSLAVRRGEVTALLGQNGCGKSTLVKVLAGFHAPEPGGEMLVGGQVVDLPVPPERSRELGLSFVFQDLGLAPGLSVVENLTIGMRTAASLKGRRVINWKQERRRARETFASYHVAIDPDAEVQELAPVDQALLAIIRAAEEQRLFRGRTASRRSSILVLDEPTVFLPASECELLFSLIRRVASTSASVILISHDLEAVREVADRVVVLRDGRVSAETDVASVTHEELIEMIVGRRTEKLATAVGGDVPRAELDRPRPATAVADPLRVSHLSGGRVVDVSFTLRAGEVLGLAGLLGSGVEEFPYQLFGSRPASGGTIDLAGLSVPAKRMTPQLAMKSRTALVPADRARDGGVGTLPVEENLLLLVEDRYFIRGIRRRRAIRRTATERCAEFGIRPPSPEALLSSLSGGNAQKVILAKWLEIDPRIIILHEPTQGVDVGARSDFYELVKAAAAKGAGVLWITTDFDELATMCDRVLIVGNGMIFGELRRPDISKNAISELVFRASASLSVRPGGELVRGFQAGEQRGEGA
jgi:ribose transport system ATP-binding protein